MSEQSSLEHIRNALATLPSEKLRDELNRLHAPTREIDKLFKQTNEASKLLAIVPGVRFEFLPGLVRITVGRIVVGGSFQVEGANRLRFVPASLVGLPAGLNPVIELGSLPFARCTSRLDVKIEEGKVAVTCSQDHPPVSQG